MYSVLLTKYYSGDQIKNEMGRACGMYGGQDKCIQGFGGDLMEINHLEDLGVKRIIIKWIFTKKGEEACIGLLWLRKGT